MCIIISFKCYRIYLAALHYNENAGREQAHRKDGGKSFSISYPRAKLDTGGYSVRKLLVQCTYGMYTLYRFFVTAAASGLFD